MRAALLMGVLGTAVLLASCAGRNPNPEPQAWIYDKYYTCQDIRAEKDRIFQEAQNRGVEQAFIRSRDNDLMARTIPFLPPAMAAVEEGRMGRTDKTAQEVEIDGLMARDKHLDGMAADRGC